MKLIVAGIKYPLQEALQGATLRNLYVLKMQTGIVLKTIRDTFKGMEAARQQAEKEGREVDPLDFVENEEGLLALQAMVWLCKKHAGESSRDGGPLGVGDAADFPMSQIGFETEDAEAPKPDPTEARTDSDPGAALPALEPSNT
ncbi:hypothetical protein [Arthrobacter silvisoli]|uniref:hypothetical protein n=1 Tax=Arthrobacter silvisoli TaxID=2291022 RepID=UPI000E20D75D|nr:hypothetical protein [Arthrobacter silvisoli]